MSLADCQSYVAETGPLPNAIGVSGGGSQSRFWIRIVSSALNRTLVHSQGSEAGPAFGAARLARISVTGEDPAEVCLKPEIAAEIEPEPPVEETTAELVRRLTNQVKSHSGPDLHDDATVGQCSKYRFANVAERR